MTTAKLLDLSTAHVTGRDGKLLTVLYWSGADGFSEETGLSPRPCLGAFEYGGVFSCNSSALDEPEYVTWSTALLDVLRFARGRGFDHVLFDSDASPSAELPVFKW